MRIRDAGYTFIEFAVALALLSLLILLVMPSLQGYQANAQVRTFGEQVVEQARAAQLAAVTEDQQVGWLASYDNPPYSIQFWGNVNGELLSQVTLPPTMHVTGQCYRGRFTPQGFITSNCGTPGATFEMLCFDSNTANPLGFEIEVVVATGQVIGLPIAGRCH